MGRPLSVFWLCLLAVSVICACWPLSWGRYLSIFRPCLLAVPVGRVCCLCLLSALVAAAPFYRLAVPVGCACWPCLLSVSVGHVCCLCLLAALVGAVPRVPPARRYPGFRRRGGTPASTSAAIPRVAHRGAARADPPSGAANATTARPHSNAPRGQILRFCRS